MRRAGFVALVALASLGAAPGEGPAGWLDALRWNARERTAAGLADLEAGRAAAAAEELDAALGLRPDDPLVRFNAGTGRLAAGRPDAAAPLEQAARAAPGELAPDAWYNLGAARLAGGDAAGAASAFIETLRREPGRADAKRNLELALRALEQERQRQEQGGADPEGEATPSEGSRSSLQPNPGGRDDSGAEPDGERQGAENSDPEGGAQDRGQGDDAAATPDGTPRPEGDRRALPRFHDQPEMTAEQAAALLRAVESLERDERRRRARERALAAGTEEIDW